MTTIPTDADQIQSVIDSAKRLGDAFGRPLPAYDPQTYLRPVPGGCSVLSISPGERSQQGVTKTWGRGPVVIKKWIRDRDDAFKRRERDEAAGTKKTRSTPEKDLQSFLISDAIEHGGWMRALMAGCSETPQPRLRFLIDEVAFRKAKGEGKDVFDLMAIREQAGAHVMVAIELKSDRLLTRITNQVNTSAEFMERNRADLERLAEACWGERIRLADQAERWIVWKANMAGRHGDADPRADVCRAKGIRLVTYAKTSSGSFVLHAAVPRKT